MDRAHPPVDRILEEASRIARKGKTAAGNAKSAEGYKRGQTEELKRYATFHNLWIDLSQLPLTYIDKGGENEVYYDGESSVIKLNNFEYAGEDLTNFFTRIFAHNLFFGNVPYQMIGFAYNSQQEFSAVLTQPYIFAQREATPQEIALYMKALKFEMIYEDEFHNEQYEIFDAAPNNVLYGIDNDLYFIDTQIRIRSSYRPSL